MQNPPTPLRGVCAQLSLDGSPNVLLMQGKFILQSLPLIPALPEHRSFILSTWMRSYEAQARKQRIAGFYAASEPAIAESRWQDCTVLTDEDSFTVHAWVCGSEGNLWHCYVVPELRRLRVATRMIEYACGGKVERYARPWPYGAHAQVDPYLLCRKNNE